MLHKVWTEYLKRSGNLGDISCLYFSTKSLGCYGDGGAVSLITKIYLINLIL